jgi:hypothetical protein
VAWNLPLSEVQSSGVCRASDLEDIMANLIWILVVILVIAWLLGLGGIFHLAASLIWIILVIAVILAVIAFLTGGYLG